MRDLSGPCVGDDFLEGAGRGGQRFCCSSDFVMQAIECYLSFSLGLVIENRGRVFGFGVGYRGERGSRGGGFVEAGEGGDRGVALSGGGSFVAGNAFKLGAEFGVAAFEGLE